MVMLLSQMLLGSMIVTSVLYMNVYGSMFLTFGILLRFER